MGRRFTNFRRCFRLVRPPIHQLFGRFSVGVSGLVAVMTAIGGVLPCFSRASALVCGFAGWAALGVRRSPPGRYCDGVPLSVVGRGASPSVDFPAVLNSRFTFRRDFGVVVGSSRITKKRYFSFLRIFGGGYILNTVIFQ